MFWFCFPLNSFIFIMKGGWQLMYVCIYIHVYICLYIYRERERILGVQSFILIIRFELMEVTWK